jgi:hypothetical protein
VATYETVFLSFCDKLKEKFQECYKCKCKFRWDLFIIQKQIEAGCVGPIVIKTEGATGGFVSI